MTAYVEPDLIQPDRNDRLLRRPRREQIWLCGPSDEQLSQSPRTGTALGIQFAQLCHRLLDDLAAHPHRAHQLPVRMDLALFTPCRMAEVHREPLCASDQARVNGVGRHYIVVSRRGLLICRGVAPMPKAKKDSEVTELWRLG